MNIIIMGSVSDELKIAIADKIRSNLPQKGSGTNFIIAGANGKDDALVDFDEPDFSILERVIPK